MKTQLSQEDFDLLQAGILELNSFRDLKTFRNALPGIMLRLIPAEYFVWNEILFIEGTPNLVDFVESTAGVLRPFVQRMTPLFPEHPFNASFMGNPDPTPLMFSDFYTLEELFKTRLYQVAHAPVAHNPPHGWCRQLSVPVLLHPGLISSLNFVGHQEDFTERDREILNIVRKHFKQAYQNTEAATARATAISQPLMSFQLTFREAEIGLWLAEGKSNPEIAAILGLSPRTVEKHVENILAKLKVENRTAAAVLIAGSQRSQPGDPSRANLPSPAASAGKINSQLRA
jgi:DNA-binding CsgD family transcriptional regulator